MIHLKLMGTIKTTEIFSDEHLWLMVTSFEGAGEWSYCWSKGYPTIRYLPQYFILYQDSSKRFAVSIGQQEYDTLVKSPLLSRLKPTSSRH
jgi:hypothetical protein